MLRRADWRRWLPGLTVAALAAAAPGWLRQTGELRGPALWGALLLAAWAGWGDLVAGRLMPDAPIDLPLRAAWGLALTVAAGGLLALVGLARRPVLIGWTAAGAGLAATAAVRSLRGGALGRWRAAAADAGWYGPLAAGLVVVTVFLALGSIGHSFPNPSDDWPAYLPLVHKLQQTGTLIEPFSVRRMAAYGGQTLMQAFALVVARDTQIQLFDGGVCLVLAVGLVLGAARSARDPAWPILLLAACLPIMLPDDRSNSASEVSGVVGFVALWRTIACVDAQPRQDRGTALAIALMAAMVATLRQNYLPAVACVLLCLSLPRPGAVAPELRRRFFGWAVAGCAAFLAPWALMALRSNHTFLFPLIHGNYDPRFAGISRPALWHERLKFLFADALYTEPVHTMPLVLIAAPAVALGAARRATLGLWAGTMVAFALLAWSLPDSDTYTVARYDLGYAVALVMAAGLAIAADDPARPRPWPAVALVVAALALQVHGNHGALHKSLDDALDRVRSVDTSPATVTADPEVERRMQAAVPPGARLLTMIERPFLLDFSRNQVDLLDQPGAASPAPGIPLIDGVEPTASYLLGQGIRYFAFTRPDRSTIPLYGRQHWREMAASKVPLWQAATRIYLATFDVLDGLARTRRRLYDDGRLVVVDLSGSTPTSSRPASRPGG